MMEHMTSRTTDDYERMAAAGVRALVEPAFWLGQPRTNAGLVRRLLRLADRLGAVPGRRSSASGTTATIALNPKEANDPRCREVLDLLPRYLDKDGVVAVGEIGYDSMTPAEDEVVRRPAGAGGRRTSCPRWCTPRTGTRPPAPGARLDVVKESGIDPGRVAARPPQRGDRRRWSRTPAAGWASPSTRTPRCRRRGWSRSCAEYGLERMLVNSAADWGQLRPAADPAHRRGDARGRVQPTTTSTGCCGATRSSSTASPGRLDLSDERTAAGDGRPSRATRSCAAARDAAAAPRRPDACTSPTAPTCTPPRTSPASLASSTRTRCRSASGSAPTCSASGLWLAAPVAAGLAADRGAAAAAAPRAGRPRAGGGHPQRVPVPGLPGAGGQARRLPAGLDRPAHGWRTPWTWRRCWPTCCPTTPPAARSPRCRWPGASRGTPSGRRRRARAARRARRRAGRRGWTGRRSGSRSSRSRAASSRPPTQAVAHLSGVDTDRLGVCLDLAHLACAWEDPADGRRPAARRRPAGRQGPGVGRAGGRRPGRGRATVLARVRRAALPAPDPRPRGGAAFDDLDEALAAGAPGPWRVHFHVPLHAAAGAAAAHDHRRAARRPGRAARRARRAATTSRSRPTPGACCRRRCARTTPAGLAAGIAAELAFARDRAAPTSACEP